MFPLRDDNPHFLTPYVTYAIIALNILAWVLLQGMGSEPALAVVAQHSGRIAVALPQAQC
jgi:membrane associated rhomboid family serine protease